MARARIGQADLQQLTCDLCQASIGPRQDRWSCAACDWDVCAQCRGAGDEQWSAQRIADDVAALLGHEDDEIALQQMLFTAVIVVRRDHLLNAVARM